MIIPIEQISSLEAVKGWKWRLK